MEIYTLTEVQLESLSNIEGLIFNPVQDVNDQWGVSANEYYYILGLYYLDECPENLLFIKDLTTINYTPKPNEI